MSRGFLVPAGCYLAFALLVPLLGGGYRSAAFWRHAAVVLCVVALAWLLGCAVRAVMRAAMRAAMRGALR